MFLSINCYSQKEEGNVWREAAKYLYDEGFDRDDLRNTIEIVREMSKEFFEKGKFSKKNDKKLKKSFSQEQIDKLKTLSKKMAKLVDFNQKEENINSRPSNQNFSRGTGGQFNRGGNISRAEMLSRIRNRTGSSAGAGNFSRGNRNRDSFSIQSSLDYNIEDLETFFVVKRSQKKINQNNYDSATLAHLRLNFLFKKDPSLETFIQYSKNPFRKFNKRDGFQFIFVKNDNAS